MATFVLVHGTSAGGWVFKHISKRLRAAGHEPYTLSLTGCGDRVHLATPEVGLTTHVTDVVNLLEYEDLRDVVLLGHSYGGMVISGVAERVPERIGHLVFHDAIVPRDGECLLDHQSAEQRRAMEEQVRARGDGWRIPLSRGPNDVSTKNTEHPWKSWAEPLKMGNPAAVSIPRTYLRCTADKGPGQAFAGIMELSLSRAKEGGWRIKEMNTVHQISPNPEIVAATLLELF
jgi:pimeloyl-ACP methyl ester carboxylesterase